MSGLTLFHVIVSLVAIIAGIAMARGLLTAHRLDRWTMIFMITTAVTLITGFMLYVGFTPGIAVGILCCIIFVPTALARYKFDMQGFWRPVFVVGALMLFYFNCLVLVVQSFQKVPALNALAPVGNEPAVVITQSVVFVAFLIVGFLSIRRFHPTILGA